MSNQPERQIGFEQLGLGSVLGRHTLIVPANQREYSWTEAEISSLFYDLAKAIEEGASDYFLGSIVTIPKEPGTLEVVDGQQRLATTAILLAAIRNYLRSQDSKSIIAEDLERFLGTIDRKRGERVARLRLNVADGVYFEQRILGAAVDAKISAPSHQLIHEAALGADKHVKKIVGFMELKHHAEQLNRWVDFIEHRALVILMKVPSDVNAYKMFETLNDRGLKTSQADLVKNYLFGQAGKRLPEAQSHWGAMKAILESIDEDDITITFLRQVLISLHGYLRESDVYEKVQAKAKGETMAVQFLASLQESAADYTAILNADHEKWNAYPPQTRSAIRTLINLRMRPSRPLQLAIARRFEPNEAPKAFRLLVAMAVRFLVVGGARSGTVEQAFADTAMAVSEGKASSAKDILALMDKRVPKDAEFESAFTTASVSAAALARYYLRALELAHQGVDDPCFIPNDDAAAINLEHVLPREPEGNWPNFTPEVADAMYRRIGNLCLLQAKANSGLGSKPFAEKAKVYKDTMFALTSQIGKLDEWTPDTILKRQSVLAKLAIVTWPLGV